MSRPDISFDFTSRKLKLVGALLAVSVVSLVGLLGLIAITVRDIRESRVAEHDIIFWDVFQLDVDYLRLELALAHHLRTASAGSAAVPPRDVAQAYYILLSRLAVVETVDDTIAGHGGNLEELLAGVSERIRGLSGKLSTDGSLTSRDTQFVSDTLARDRREVRKYVLAALESAASEATATRARATGLAQITLAVGLGSAALLLLTAVWAAIFLHRTIRQARNTAWENAQLDLVFRESRDGIAVIDPGGAVHALNAGAEEILGVTEGDLLGCNVFDDYGGLRFFRRLRADLSQNEPGQSPALLGIGRRIYPMVRADGRRFLAEVSVALAHRGEVVLVLIHFADATARLAADKARRIAQAKMAKAMAFKSRFLTVMSHELRTPIAGVIGAIDLMERNDLSVHNREMLDLARTCCADAVEQIGHVLHDGRADRLIDAELAFSPEVCMARTLHQLRPLAVEKKLIVTAEVKGGPIPPVLGSERAFTLALRNLVSNALRYTPAGSVWVTIAAASAGEEQLHLRVEVADTGIGISKADQARIFDEEVTLASGRYPTQGSGLGLVIARQAALGMGGEIGVESTPGVGSRFWFTAVLPAASEGAEVEKACPPTDEPVRPAPQSLTIVVAEDVPTIRQLIERMIIKLGHRAVMTEDGQQAVRMVCERRPDLVIMDVAMPELDGLQATKILRRKFPHLPIVGLTAFDDPDEIAGLLQAGMTRVATKPLSREALGQVIVDVVSPARPQAAEVDEDRPCQFATVQDLVGVLGVDEALQLIDRFVEETRKTLDEAHLAAREADRARVHELLHRLAGSAAIVGANRLRQTVRCGLIAAEAVTLELCLDAIAKARAELAASEPALRSAVMEVKSADLVVSDGSRLATANYVVAGSGAGRD